MNYPVEYTVITENEKIYIEGGADYWGLFNYLIGDYLRDSVLSETRSAVWSSAKKGSTEPLQNWFKNFKSMGIMGMIGYIYGIYHLAPGREDRYLPDQEVIKVEERKFKKWGWKALLALLGLAAAGAFGFFSIFNTVRVAAAEPALSENEANEAASVTITDAELEQLLSGELTLDSLTRTGTDEAPAASEAQGIAAGEQPARTESEAAASSEPEDSASGTEQSAASSSKAPVEEKQQEAACEAEVKALIQQTYALKAIAEKGLNSSISAAKAEYKTLPAEQQTKTKKIMICLSKTGELTSLQSYCDKEMGRIVSQLRTVLKENGQSTELADQVMSTYKAEKSQRYAELKNKLYNG